MKTDTLSNTNTTTVLNLKKAFCALILCLIGSIGYAQLAQKGKCGLEQLDYSSFGYNDFEYFVEASDLEDAYGNALYSARLWVDSDTKTISEVELWERKTQKTIVMSYKSELKSPIVLPCSWYGASQKTPAGTYVFKDKDTKVELYYKLFDKSLIFYVPGAPSNFSSK